MTLCHYSEILQIAAELAGLAYAYTVGESGLSVDEERGLRTSVNTQMAMLWPKGKWPGITRVEQRAFRLAYASGTTYQLGTEVFFPQTQKYYLAIKSGGFSAQAPADSLDALNSAYWANCASSYSGPNYSGALTYAAGDIVFYPVSGLYYQCHTASTGNVPSNTSFWGVLVPFDPYISYTQTGQTEIWEQGEIILWTLNPRLTTRAVMIPSFLSQNGIQPAANYPAQPFVEFKIRVPNLIGDRWSASSTYAVGDQVQFETSSGNVAFLNFYTCVTITAAGESPTTAAAKWSRVELPDLFKHYLGAKAAVAWLVGEGDGRFTIAEQVAAEAESNLNDLLYRVQGQVPRTQVMG